MQMTIVVLAKSKCVAERLLESCLKYLEGRLKLKMNTEKSKVTSIFAQKKSVSWILFGQEGKRHLHPCTPKVSGQSNAPLQTKDSQQGYRSGHYDRNLTTTSGDVTLHVPRLKGVSFETAIIERYRRRESSVEEALIEMYLAGVSVRRVEDITEALWGSKVSPATISELNKKAYIHIEDWRNRPLQGGHYPYVYVDGIYLRRNWGGKYENVSVLVAIAVNEDGFREVLGAAEGMKEDKASWVSFFQWLRGRGLDGVKLIVGDKCMGMLEAVGEVFPDAKYQRCTVISTATFSLLCQNPRSKLWQKCSRRSTPRRAKKRPARRQRLLLPSCAP